MDRRQIRREGTGHGQEWQSNSNVEAEQESPRVQNQNPMKSGTNSFENIGNQLFSAWPKKRLSSRSGGLRMPAMLRCSYSYWFRFWYALPQRERGANL